MNPEQPLRIQLDVKVRMRDGVELSAGVYRPLGPGPFPTLLIRTIYNNKQDRYVDWTRQFVESGYAVVMQDCRGRYDSDGPWEPYVHEAEDGYDTQQWIGDQSWCDGNIGTFGISYVGFTQTLPAPLRSPYTKALVPIASQQDNYGHIYVDGALHLHVAMAFHIWVGRGLQTESRNLMNEMELYSRLPLISALDDIADVPWYRDIVRHNSYDDFWRRYGLRDKYQEVETPAYFITGWYDALVHESFKQFNGWRSQARSAEARRVTRLMVGPWLHGTIGSSERIGDVDFGPQAEVDIVGEHIRWYDRRLRGIENGIDDEPNVFALDRCGDRIDILKDAGFRIGEADCEDGGAFVWRSLDPSPKGVQLHTIDRIDRQHRDGLGLEMPTGEHGGVIGLDDGEPRMVDPIAAD